MYVTVERTRFRGGREWENFSAVVEGRGVVEWRVTLVRTASMPSLPGKTRVYLENTRYFADFSDFSQILLQKSCKYYHHLIVLAVECLIVLGGYTSKWPALLAQLSARRLSEETGVQDREDRERKLL